MNTNQANQYFIQASHFYKVGDTLKAKEVFQKILEYFPDELNSKAMLALCYLQNNELRQSYDLLKECLSYESKNIFFLSSMGNVLSKNNNYEDAKKCFEKVLQIDEQYIDAINGLAIIYFKQNDISLAKKYFKHSVLKDNIIALNYLISIAKKETNFADIIDLYNKALKIDKNFYKKAPDTFYDLAISYMNLSDYDNAKSFFHKALPIANKNKDNVKKIYNSLAICHQNLLELDEAMNFYIKSFSIDFNFAKAHWNLSTLYLLQGDYENGWKKYEWRKKMDNYKSSTHGQLPSTKAYNGEDLKGKILSIKSEQGLGDTIQFARYVSSFTDTNVKKIIFRTHSELVDILKQLENEKIEVVGEGNMDKLHSDYEVELMSLPLYFNSKTTNIPFSQKYLKNTRSKKIDINLSSNQKNIGIVWQGNSKYKNNKKRIIQLSMLKEIINLKQYKFYSIQKEDMQEEINNNNLNDKITNLSPIIKTWEDTISLIDQLDFVISIDTSLAHLSGAMGKKTILLLQYMPDFRWLLNTDKSIWYDSISIIRQTNRDNWDNVIDALSQKLQN